MNKRKYAYLTNTYDDKDKIYALKKDVKEICKKCSVCDGADIKDGCGCLIAYTEICYRNKPIFYGSELKLMELPE